MSTIGYLHSLESFGLVDGPGVRCVVFLKGCHLRCQYCHNPDTWSGEGTRLTAEELFRQVIRYKPYWKNNGGLTVSGGEPLLQMAFLTELFTLAQQAGVSTALDTAGEPFRCEAAYLAELDGLLAVTDLVLLDLKMMDTEGHRRLTGAGNENILAFARYLSDHGKRLWIRHVLVPGLTDDEDDLTAMHRFIASLKTVDRVEVLPYHTLGAAKWEQLGRHYPLTGVPVPDKAAVQRAEALLHTHDYG